VRVKHIGGYSANVERLHGPGYATPSIRRMICAVLAGYAWDESNAYVADPVRRLNALHEVCTVSAQLGVVH
jgi:hypothetical protein